MRLSSAGAWYSVFGLLVPVLPVYGGSDPFIAFEEVDKVAGIHIAQLCGDLGNAFGGGAKLGFGKLDFLAVYIICEALPNLAVEQAGEIAGAQVTQVCHFVHGQGLARVRMNVAYRRVNGAALGNRALLGGWLQT